MKLYIEEETTETIDGDRLITVKVHESEPEEFTYLVFVDK